MAPSEEIHGSLLYNYIKYVKYVFTISQNYEMMIEKKKQEEKGHTVTLNLE